MKAEAMEPWAIFTLRELAQMWSAGEELGMSEGIIDITQLPQMFKELEDEVRQDIWWSGYLKFSTRLSSALFDKPNMHI